MERRRFDSSAFEVAVVGQGTWQVESRDPTAVVGTLQRGLDLGMNHIDTAEMYGNGAAEKLVGAALARLRTDRLDCYLLHWRGEYPLEETIAAFQQLKDAGKILSWGVSNFDEPDLEEALQIAGPGAMVCNQVLYHLGERAIEHRVLPWCEKHGLAVVGYSPFGHGDFPDPSSPGGRVLAEIAKAHAATPRQVALRFLFRKPSFFTIPKASSVKHVEENAGAGDLQLTADELARIDRAFPLGRPPREMPTL
jgi:diketogulonate reductase-like aldo/keto reductase